MKNKVRLSSNQIWILQRLKKEGMIKFDGGRDLNQRVGKALIKTKLVEFNSEKLKQFSITTQDQAVIAKNKLVALADGKLKVVKVTKSKRKRKAKK